MEQQRLGFSTLAEVEREHIIRVVAAKRNMAQAARVLGIGRTTLYRKLGEYGFRPGEYTPPAAK